MRRLSKDPKSNATLHVDALEEMFSLKVGVNVYSAYTKAAKTYFPYDSHFPILWCCVYACRFMLIAYLGFIRATFVFISHNLR